MILNAYKAKQFLVFITKVFILCAAFYFLYQQIKNNPQLSWHNFQNLIFQKLSFLQLVAVLLFSIANRFFEILKWQNLVSYLKPISIFEATKQVLGALTAGIFTPNGLGEYAGKVIFFNKKETLDVLFLNLICNGVQMILVLVFGILGLFFMGFWQWAMLLIAVIAGLFVFAFLGKNIHIKGYAIKQFIDKTKTLTRQIHQKNIAFALCRYLVLIHQYYFLLVLFDVKIAYPVLIATIAAVQFLSASLPSFQFLDFAVKGSIAVYFFHLLGINDFIILFISSLMWLLNVVLPVIIGSYFVLAFKMKVKG